MLADRVRMGSGESGLVFGDPYLYNEGKLSKFWTGGFNSTGTIVRTKEVDHLYMSDTIGGSMYTTNVTINTTGYTTLNIQLTYSDGTTTSSLSNHSLNISAYQGWYYVKYSGNRSGPNIDVRYGLSTSNSDSTFNINGSGWSTLNGYGTKILRVYKIWLS